MKETFLDFLQEPVSVLWMPLYVRLSNSQFNKLKLGIKIGTGVVFHQMWLVILVMKLIFHIKYY